MRRHPVAGDQVAAVDEFAADVAVQVHGGRDQHVVTHRLADTLQQNGFGVVDAFDGHRAVDVEPQTVEPRQRGEPFDDLVAERSEGRRGHDARPAAPCRPGSGASRRLPAAACRPRGILNSAPGSPLRAGGERPRRRCGPGRTCSTRCRDRRWRCGAGSLRIRRQTRACLRIVALPPPMDSSVVASACAKPWRPAPTNPASAPRMVRSIDRCWVISGWQLS